MLYALGWLFGYTYLWFNVYILGISLYFPSFYMYRLRFLCSSIHYVRQSAKEMPIFFYSGYSFHCRCFLYVVLFFCCLFIATNSVFSFFIPISSIHRVLCNFFVVDCCCICCFYFMIPNRIFVHWKEKQESKTKE